MRDYFMATRLAVMMLLWPITTFAAGASLGDSMGAITAADWVSLAILAAVSGLVALMQRMRKSFEALALQAAGKPADEEDLQLIDWRLFAACHMLGAMFVGLLAFLICEWWDVNSYLEATYIALASWRGAKLADQMADGLGDNLKDRIAGAFGGKKE